MSERLWVLGAGDPEMQMAETLLREAGETVAYAIGPDGRRVFPGNAYRATDLRWSLDPADATGPAWDSVTHLIECAPVAEAAIRSDVRVIDHHRPGDPGFGRSPAEFVAASSIGQVIAELRGWGVLGRDWRISMPMILCAAADHCLAAAYRGECPEVDPDDLMEWRIASRAAFQGRPAEAILADVEAVRVVLRDAKRVALIEGSVHCAGSRCGCGPQSYESGDENSSTRHGSGDCYCDCVGCSGIWAADMRGRKVPELPEASAREGVCFVADGLPDPDGRVKVVCQSGSRDQIRAFLETWAPAQGLVDLYGDPARGFAGGYLVG